MIRYMIVWILLGMILQTGIVCSSFLGTTSVVNKNHLPSYLPNITNTKFRQKKSGDDFSESNNPNFKQKTNKITVGSIVKERSLFAFPDDKYHFSSVQCGTSLDMCGVCAGDNNCISCNTDNPDYKTDACGNCISPDDPSWNNCTTITSIHPLVLDKAFNSSVELKLELSKVIAEGDSLKCSIFQNNRTIEAKVISADETVVTLAVPLQPLAAESQLQCEGWTMPKHTLVQVNSLSLSVSSVTPKNISLGVPTQLKLMVHGISAPVDLFCFVMNQNKTVLVIEPTNQISGNPMSSIVVCSVIVSQPVNSQLFIGVSFTRTAISRLSNNNTIGIKMLPPSLIPLRADFSEDLSSVWVEFNHNIEGATDCSGIFKNSSLNLLGTGIKCEYRGNKLVVKLGKGARLHPRDVLRLSQNTNSTIGLYFAGSKLPSTLSQDTVHLPFSQTPIPSYMLVGPSKICHNALSSVTVVPLSGQELRYNWSLFVTEAQPATKAQLKQRHNLLVWLGAREMVKPARRANLDSLLINSSLLMPNIYYRLEVVGQNHLGFMGPPVSLNLQLTKTNTGIPLGLVILSPRVSAVSQPLPLEVKVTSGCGLVCLDHVKFHWKVEKDNQTVTLSPRWVKVIAPRKVFLTPGLYNISCVMTNDSVILAQAQTQVLVHPARIVLTVVPAALVLRTGQPLSLDISQSLQNFNISSLQIIWKCTREDGLECFPTGLGKPVPVPYGSTMILPKLRLPFGALPIGRYKWTVVVRQHGLEYTSSARVEVLGGNLSLLNAGPPVFVPSLFIPASAQDLRPGCRLHWTSIPGLGYNILPLNNVTGVDREITRGTKGDLALKIPETLLQTGAYYYLRFSAFCSAAEYVYTDFIISVNPKPIIEGLKVSPLQGVALQTQFNFSIKRSSKFGSTYSFGYYLPSGSASFFYSSAYYLSTLTLLPAFIANGSQIKTVAKVCSIEQVCTTQDGPVIQTTLPTSLSPQEISYMSKLVSSAVENGDPLEAVTSITAILSTTKLLADQTAFKSISTNIIESILQKINTNSERLKKDISTRPESILFLDSVTRVLPLLRFNDSALSIVVTFRDLLASTPKPSAKPMKMVNSLLPLEPRASRGKRQQPIPSETSPETPDTVEIWLRTSETAILSFSPTKSLEEKQKLLTNLNSYVSGLCQWLPDSQPVYLGGQVVSLSVQKLSIGGNSIKLKPINIPNCLEKCGTTAKVYLDKEFLSSFKKIKVGDICLSGFRFPSGSLEAIFSRPSDFIQLSAVYRLHIYTYSVSTWLKNDSSPDIQLVIPLQASSPTSFSNECCVIKSKTWMAGVCQTVEVDKSSVTCKCPPYNYYSAFAVPIKTTTVITTTLATTTESKPTTQTTTTAVATTTVTTQIMTTTTTSTTLQQTTSTPLPTSVTTDTPEPERKVAFRISEKYDNVVGENSTEFSEHIKKQLINQLNLPREAVRDTYVTNGVNEVTAEGSILVTLALRSTDQMSAEESLMELAQALDIGELHLRSADNQPLNVPKQPLVVLRDYSGGQEGLSAMFLASASLGLCGLVMVYVALVSFVTRHTRRKEALRAVQRKAAEKIPRYPTLPLPHTLDGSSFRQGTWNGDDLDSGIYDSDGGRKNLGQQTKQRNLRSTNF